MSRPSAVATVQIDNERVKVTEWSFPPLSETGWHTHDMDYVVVPMTTGPLQLDTQQGQTTSELVAGQSYSRQAGVHHNVINPSNSEFVFVEIEIK